MACRRLQSRASFLHPRARDRDASPRASYLFLLLLKIFPRLWHDSRSRCRGRSWERQLGSEATPARPAPLSLSLPPVVEGCSDSRRRGQAPGVPERGRFGARLPRAHQGAVGEAGGPLPLGWDTERPLRWRRQLGGSEAGGQHVL